MTTEPGRRSVLADDPGSLTVAPIIGYARAVRSHLALSIAIVAVAVVGAAGWLATHAPKYEASAKLLVNPVPDGDTSFFELPILRGSGAEPQRPVTTAATLIESPEAARRAARELDSGISPQQVTAAIEATARDGENIVEVTATAGNPDEAADIANTYVDAALAVRREMLEPRVDAAIERTRAELEALGDLNTERASELEARLSELQSIEDGTDPTLEVASPASAPDAPVGAPRWLILALALGGGITIAATTAIVIELLAPGAIGSEDDLLGLFPLPILARVPRDPTRSRRSPSIAGSPPAHEAFRMLRGQLEVRHRAQRAGANGMGEGSALSGTIAITSPMTGDGKTTVALGLGAVTAAAGNDVVVLEADLRRPRLATLLEIDPEHNLADLLVPDPDLDRVATRFSASGPLRVVPAPAANNMAMVERVGAGLPMLLAELAAGDRCVIVDTAALGEVSDALALLARADHVVITIRLRHTSQAALISLRDSIERAGVKAAGFVVLDAPSTVTQRPEARLRFRHRRSTGAPST